MVTATINALDRIRISDHPALDRRRRLSDDQKLAIRKAWFNVHEAERPTMTALGEAYSVHRTAIAGILYPEREARKREQYKQRAKDGRYYDSERARKNIKNCRAYKMQLLQEGKLDA